MLSEKIAVLYKLLQCNNTDIARYAGCSPGNISRLKTGNRAPGPESRSIRVFAEGVYGYADYENMLPVLQKLCGAADASRETLIPAVIAWLFGAESTAPLPQGTVPKSRLERDQLRQSFGTKLDSVMTLLDITNGQLASLLNVDPSLVSRYRSGLYSPHGNPRLSEKLSLLLLSRAQKSDLTAELAQLCSVKEDELDSDSVIAWLYRTMPPMEGTAMVQLLLQSLDNLMPGQKPSFTMPDILDMPSAAQYFGTEGLRQSVIRFLSDAARDGGELLLYSDEPMEWMVHDPSFFALWKSLMLKCVTSGVKIRIIHNVNRDFEEMLDAIRGWFPLYMSGMIEPYVFRRERNPRFYHTIFLRTGSACIHGFFPTESGDSRWYEYITDETRLKILSDEYIAMLSTAAPFLKAFTCTAGETYRSLRTKNQEARKYLVSEFPAFTMPEALLERILARAPVSEKRRAALRSLYHQLRGQFEKLLQQGPVDVIFCPQCEDLQASRKINFGLDLIDLSVNYTTEEYIEHLAAIRELVKTEKNFHLSLMTEAPFRDIQITMAGDSVAVLRSREPYAAFVFTNPDLSDSVSEYLSLLTKNGTADRHAVLEMLE